MKTFNQFTIEEAKVHPMAVHAYSVGGGSYKVHAVGSKVEHVKAGETIRSSDLDDLTDAGHKVKEINKPMNEARNNPKSPTGMGHSSDAHFNQQSQKMQDAINMHLRNGKDYPEAVKAAKVHVKEAHSSVRDKVNEYMKEEAVEKGYVAVNEGFGVFRKGVKHNPVNPIKVHKTKEKADKHAKRLNSIVSPYVYSPYGEKYHVKPMSEEAELDEALGTIKNMKAASKFGSSNVSDMIRGEKARKAGMAKVSTTKDIGYKVVDVGPGQKETVRKMHNFKEEEDQINEISSDTLISYSQKAHNQIKGNQPADPDKLRKRTNREQGIKLAFNKHYQVRTKVPATIKEEEIDEAESGLSTKTLAGYSMKASDASKHTKLPTSKVDNRYAGVSKVDKILAARDKKKVD